MILKKKTKRRRNELLKNTSSYIVEDKYLSCCYCFRRIIRVFNVFISSSLLYPSFFHHQLKPLLLILLFLFISSMLQSSLFFFISNNFITKFYHGCYQFERALFYPQTFFNFRLSFLWIQRHNFISSRFPWSQQFYL